MLSLARSIALGALAAGAIAQSTTLDLFINGNSDQKYVGSIVAADSSETTIALVCTEGTFEIEGQTQSCNQDATATAIYKGSTIYELSTSAAIDGFTITISESCSIHPTTEAVCLASASASIDGQKTSTETTTTYTGSQVAYFQVPITAGASKLPSATGASKSSSGAAPTAAAELFKVVIVPGAAALLAGAAML